MDVETIVSAVHDTAMSYAEVSALFTLAVILIGVFIVGVSIYENKRASERDAKWAQRMADAIALSKENENK